MLVLSAIPFNNRFPIEVNQSRAEGGEEKRWEKESRTATKRNRSSRGQFKGIEPRNLGERCCGGRTVNREENRSQ